MWYIAELMDRHNRNKAIVPSAMDEGCEIHTAEYAKLHTKIAFQYNNSVEFNFLSKIAEDRTIGELGTAIDILVELLDARTETTREILDESFGDERSEV